MDQRPAPQAPPGGRYRLVEMLRAEWVVIEPAQQTVHRVARPVTHLVNRVAHRSRSLYRYHRSTYYAKRTIEVLGFRTAAALRTFGQIDRSVVERHLKRNRFRSFRRGLLKA